MSSINLSQIIPLSANAMNELCGYKSFSEESKKQFIDLTNKVHQFNAEKLEFIKKGPYEGLKLKDVLIGAAKLALVAAGCFALAICSAYLVEKAFVYPLATVMTFSSLGTLGVQHLIQRIASSANEALRNYRRKDLTQLLACKESLTKEVKEFSGKIPKDALNHAFGWLENKIENEQEEFKKYAQKAAKEELTAFVEALGIRLEAQADLDDQNGLSEPEDGELVVGDEEVHGSGSDDEKTESEVDSNRLNETEDGNLVVGDGAVHSSDDEKTESEVGFESDQDQDLENSDLESNHKGAAEEANVPLID